MAALGLVTACSQTLSGTGLRLGAPVAGTPRPRALAFRDCTDQLLSLGAPVPSALKGRVRFGCATMPVPLDYHRPAGPTIKLALVRIHNTENTTRPVQSLLLNPGGPGGSGVNFALGLFGKLPTAVSRRYDLIGFDPRGVDESSPVHCLSNSQKDKLLALSPDLTTRAGVAEQAALTRQLSADCLRTVGPGLRYYNTVNTARDMDQIRQAVGDDVMNYLGFSYGTELGWTYAHLFPEQVHTFVLDGAVDPTQIDNQNSTAQLRGFESAFAQFSAWCRHAPVCDGIGDPTAAVERVFARSRESPLRTGSSRVLTRSLASTGVLEALYAKSEWPTLASALAGALRGDGSGLLALADEYNHRRSDGSYTNLLDANLVISCNDSPAQRPPTDAQILARARTLATKYPIFGADAAAPGCLGWQPHRTPVPPPSAATPKPVLVLGNLHDPATPYAGAVDLARGLGHADLLSWNGEGHTSYLEGSSCVDRYVTAYLTIGALPPPHTICPAR